MKVNEDHLLILSALIVVILAIIPIPALAVDIMIALNLIFALAILLVTIFIKKATDFYKCPKLILISTLFNLAVSTSAARLILTRGEAFDGQLIRFVSSLFTGSGGNVDLIAYFVIFNAIIVVQILVISKNATRFALTAAVRTFYYLPGKLMAADSELNSGTVGQEEHNTRRETLQQEMDFYGSMEGAAIFKSRNEKFRAFIIVVIIIAGIITSTAFHGKTIIDAAKIYFPLVIGYGILLMIPAFLISVTVGMITRPVALGDFNEKIGPPDLFSLEIGYGLIPIVDKDNGAELLERLQNMRRQIAQEMGIVVPKIRIIDNMLLDSLEYCIKICGVEVGKNTLKQDAEKTSIIVTHLTEIVKRHAAEFRDPKET